MKVMFDTSSFVKRYVEEEGSEAVARLLGEEVSELGLSVLVLPESLSGLNRRVREGMLTGAQYRAIKGQFLADIRDATIVQLTPAILSQAVALLEAHALRTLDALHVACAMEWEADILVTSDVRQQAAASKSGLATRYMGGL